MADGSNGGLQGIEVNLRPDEVRRLLQAERDCQALEKVLADLEECGRNCADIREFVRATLARCERIKSKFVDADTLDREMRLAAGSQ